LEIVKKTLDSLKLDEIDQERNSPMQLDKEDLLKMFLEKAIDPSYAQAMSKAVPGIRINILKQNLEFLKNNLSKSESDIQNWLDEQNRKYINERCLIFGLELTAPKREGCLNGKRFDILTDNSKDGHVIFELKSPNSEVFNITKKEIANEGTSSTYSLSDDLSRAIPQILSYREWYDNAKSEELDKLGIKKKKNIVNCVIVIGTYKKEDQTWIDNYKRLKRVLSGIDILTYTEIIERVENAIRNLEEINIE
jgi:hypothetical protein